MSHPDGNVIGMNNTITTTIPKQRELCGAPAPASSPAPASAPPVLPPICRDDRQSRRQWLMAAYGIQPRRSRHR